MAPGMFDSAASSANEETSRSPEHRLMLAVLQDAIAIFQRGVKSPVCRELDKYREVDAWLRSRDYDWPFSFESICSSLRIDADNLRAGLNMVRRRALAERLLPGTRKVQRARIVSRRGWRGKVR